MSAAMAGSRLFYFGTNEEVRLGDRVRIRRWIRKDLEGVVCYIPGVSPKHPELNSKDMPQWAIRIADGSLLLIGYAPDHRLGQPDRSVILVARGSAGGGDRGVLPTEKLE